MGNSLDFLTRLSTTRLLSAAQIMKLQADPQLAAMAPVQVAEELVRRKLISIYQARSLLTQAESKFDYGPYRVVGRYTAGLRAGMFQAAHRPTGYPVDLDRVDETVKSEIERHCQVRHPNLIDCYEIFDEEGQMLMAQERITGQLLVDLLKKQSISPRTACRVVQQAASACWALHANGLTHGQICPASLVIVSPKEVRLLRRPGRALHGSTTGQVSERLRTLTAETTAPEFNEGGHISYKMDVYSLGKILELLLAASAQSVPAVPKLVDSLVAISPAHRLRHAGAVAAALAEFSGSDELPTEAATGLEQVAALQERFSKYSTFLASRRADIPDGTDIPDVTSREGDAPTFQLSADDASPAALLRTRRRNARRTQIIGGAIIGLIVVGGGFFSWQSLKSDSQTSSNDVTDRGDPSTHVRPPNDEGFRPIPGPNIESTSPNPDVVSDPHVTGNDEVALWASPTSGEAIDLRYLPAGAQLYLHARPAAILAEPQGRLSLQALGPKFRVLQQAWENDLGAPLEQVDELLAAVVPRDADRPDIGWVVSLTSGTEVPAKWLSGRQVTVDDQTMVVKGSRAAWVSPAGSLVLGPETAVRDIIENRESPPLLRRELEQLRATSDVEQSITVLCAPNFIAAEGKRIIAPQLHSIVNATVVTFGDQTRGCLASLHLNQEQFYGELRLASSNERGPLQQARELRESATRVPLQMESAISSLATLDPYWRRLALRAVRMVDFAVEHTRTGVEDRTVVVNFCLPPQAAHNLLMVIELMTASSQTPNDSVASTKTVDSIKRLTLGELLETDISLDIPQQSIEFALLDLATELNSQFAGRAAEFVVRIDGPALEADAITRNQQVRDFRLDNVSVAEVLTGLVMVANPVTVQTPSDKDQKLVWVVASAGEPSRAEDRIILITTRKAAEENGYSLPAPFRAK